MKTTSYKIACIALLISAFAACKKDNEPNGPVEAQTEHRYIRLLVSDESSNQLSLVNPADGTVETFTAKYSKSSLYTTASGRFAALIHRDYNLVETFDSGFEFHGDHVDQKGTPKFATLTGEANKPTHFKTKGDEIITFNDGDGTLSIGKEGDFHTAGMKMQTVNAGNVAHHGAMTKFDNGNYAITVKDGSAAGTLPERVKLIDASGKEIAASTIQTTGIHGNASDGQVSLFGSGSGILAVDQSGNQQLIPHPANFGTAWFGTIMEASAAKKFIGYTAAMGAYTIDVAAKSVTPIIESTDIMQCRVDFAGKNLLALLHDGSLKLVDLTTGAIKKEGVIIPATAKDEKQKPTLEATERYVYVVMPKSGEVYQISTTDFNDVKKIKVSAVPYRLTIVGFENSQSHND